MNFCACDSTKPVLLIGVSHRVATVSDERRTVSPQMVTTSNFVVTPLHPIMVMHEGSPNGDLLDTVNI